MKILHVIPSLRKGGAERLVLDICNELTNRPGIDVRLVTFSNENEYDFLSKRIEHVVIPTYVIPSISGRSQVQVDKFVEFVTGFQPDVLHSHLFEADLISRWVLLPEIKYYSHCHDNMHQLQNFSLFDVLSKKRLTELYEKKLISKLYRKSKTHFVAISQHTKQYFEKVLPIGLKRNVSLLHNAIDYSRFHRPNAGSQPDKLTLINIGSFVPKKNQILFVHIIKNLLDKGVYCNGVMLGNGALHGRVKSEVVKHGLQENITMPGNVSNVEEWLWKSSVYIHVATYEPFGLVLLEAMASGLPVVALNGGGNVDLIKDGQNGCLIETQDPDVFADTILSIWQDRKGYETLQNGAQVFAFDYDIKSYVNHLLEIYKS